MERGQNENHIAWNICGTDVSKEEHRVKASWDRFTFTGAITDYLTYSASTNKDQQMYFKVD